MKPESKDELVDGIMTFLGTVTVPKMLKIYPASTESESIKVDGEATVF